jgi:hypothetical protein
MSTVEKATLLPHPAKAGETAVIKQVSLPVFVFSSHLINLN